MAFRIPRLPRAVAIVSKDGWPTQKFQQWWQEVAVAIEAAIKAIEGTIEDITAILIRLGLVEITADGALELADSAINPDGTIKSSKVVTESIALNGVTERYFAQLLMNINLPDAVPTDVVSIVVNKIEDESDIDIDASIRLASSDDIRGTINIYRDSTLVDSFPPFMNGAGGTFRISMTLPYTETGVPVGTYTYKMTFTRSGGASTLQATAGSLIRIREAKR